MMSYVDGMITILKSYAENHYKINNKQGRSWNAISILYSILDRYWFRQISTPINPSTDDIMKRSK